MFQEELQKKAHELGFDQIGFSDIDLTEASIKYQSWIAKGYHGQMNYMEAHGEKRWHPELLVPGTLSVLTLRMHYHNPLIQDAWEILNDPERAYISKYALGRDYHKLIRKRLEFLANWIESTLFLQSDKKFTYRVFSDSAPVLERALAQKGGLGFIGKNTLVIDPAAGSYFFLGEIYINQVINKDNKVFELSRINTNKNTNGIDKKQSLTQNKTITNHCGRCTKCIDICPTKAIISPYELDSRLCISYLTIEYFGSIPLELRPLIGNRIYGCDDCQLICPWNRFAKMTQELDFHPRNKFDQSYLLELFKWDETQFLKNTEGSAIRRIGHIRWLRNIAVALGNGKHDDNIINALNFRSTHENELVREHSIWAISQLQARDK